MTNISIFPEFKRLELSDKDFFYSFTKNYLPYSDFNFVSLWTYDNGETTFSMLNDNLVIAMPDYINNKPIYSFLGDKKVEDTIRMLLDYIKSKGETPELKLLPKVSIVHHKHFLDSHYTVSEDPNNSDYILSTELMSKLEGGAFHDQRNLVKQLQKEFPNHILKDLDLTDSLTRDQIIELCYLWGKRKNKTAEELDRELGAIKKLLRDAHSLSVFGKGVYIDNKLCAFFISEIVNDTYAMGHYRKANTEYPGIFTYIDHKMGEFLAEKNCKYLNFEQDLGIESLRKAKQSWQPVFYLQKYVLSLSK